MSETADPEDDPERAVRAGLRLDVTPGSGEGFLTGDAVNSTARLQVAAPPGGVVVGAAPAPSASTRNAPSRASAASAQAPFFRGQAAFLSGRH
jgi:class 3 adenylate cyclase